MLAAAAAATTTTTTTTAAVAAATAGKRLIIPHRLNRLLSVQQNILNPALRGSHRQLERGREREREKVRVRSLVDNGETRERFLVATPAIVSHGRKVRGRKDKAE